MGVRSRITSHTRGREHFVRHFGRKTRFAGAVFCLLLVTVFCLFAAPNFSSTGGAPAVRAQLAPTTANPTIANNVTVHSDSVSLGSTLDASGTATTAQGPVANTSVALHMGDIVVAHTQTNQKGEYAFSAPININYLPAVFSGNAAVYTVVEPTSPGLTSTPSAVTNLPVNATPVYAIAVIVVVVVLLCLFVFGRRRGLEKVTTKDARAPIHARLSAWTAIRHALWIAWKDLLDISRNRMGLAMLILMPLFMMGMVGYIFPSNSGMSHVPVALANLDTARGNTSLGTKFVSQLESVNNKTGMMDLSTVSSADAVRSNIQNGQQSAGIIIGSNFTSNLKAGKQADVTIVVDQSSPQTASLVQTELTQTIGQMGTQAATFGLNQTYKTPLNYSLAQVAPYNVQTTGTVPGQTNYFQFVAPGIMAMVVMMSLMTGLPHAISYEREIGTLDGMLAAPVHRMSILGGKVIAQTTRGMLQGLIVLGLSIALFGVVIQGSMVLVLGLLLLTVFSIVGLGILITSFTSTEETATMIMMTLTFPMMFLSGVFFPIQQMPQFMQVIAQFLPLTYAVTAMRRVVVLGVGLPAISTEVIVLFVFGVVLLSVALAAFERAMKR